MEAKASVAPDISHRLPAVPVPLPLAGVIGGGGIKPGLLQFSGGSSNVRMNAEGGVKHEAFCIRWKGFQCNIIDSLGGVRGDEDFADVTISCGGDGGSSAPSPSSSSSVRAHKLILASCSNYFRRILRDTPCQHPVIILGDVEHSILEALVTYMYRGEVFVSEDRLPSFFAAAQSLEIKGIAEAPLQQQHSHKLSPPQTLFSGQLRGFPFAAPPPALPSSPSSTSSASSSSPSVHPVGDLSLLAAAASATQRPSINGGGGNNDSSSSSISKRRKTTPRRLEVVNYKVPKLSTGQTSPDRSGGRGGGGRCGQDAINLSTKQFVPPPSAAESVSSIYVSKAGLLNIPNPCINFASALSKCESAPTGATKVELPSSPVALDMTRPTPLASSSVCNGSPPPLQIGLAAASAVAPLPQQSAATAASPNGDAENASPNLADIKTADGLSIMLPKVPVSAVGGGGSSDVVGDDGGDDDSEEGGGERGEGEGGEKDATSPDGLLPVSSSTTPEQMAALLGPSWKSRQPRMCQYCQRMFSNKFNLKQVGSRVARSFAPFGSLNH